MVGTRCRRVSLRRFQPRLLRRGGRRQTDGGKPDQSTVSQRCRLCWPRAAPPAAVLLRLVLGARHRSPLQGGQRRLAEVSGQGFHSDERHASSVGGSGADAHSPRQGRFGLGQSLGDHRKYDWLHQPYAAARGAGALAGQHVRAPAAAPPADHLRDQQPLPAQGRDPLPGGLRSAAAYEPAAGRTGEGRTDGPSRGGRQLLDKRSRRIALAAAARRA